MVDLGTVITGEGTPSTSEFLFVLDGKDGVRKGQYVQTATAQGALFGYVSELVRVNRYYERAESVAEYEHLGQMNNNFPVSAWEHTLAEVKILGTFNSGYFDRAHLPPHPGAKVTEADEEMLAKFLGFEDGELYLGQLQHHKLSASIDMTRLLQKHLAILAMSGSGKSYLASVLLEELLERKQEKGRIAIVVIDIHGEYCGFADDPRYAQKVLLIDGKDICVPLRRVSPEQIEEFLPSATQPGKELLRRALYELKTGSKEPYSFKKLLETIESLQIAREEVKRTLKRSLEELRRLRFLSKVKEKPVLSNDIKPGCMTILDFSSIDNLKKKQMITALIARRLFKLRKKNKIPPFLLVIEEAHNFAREKAESHEAVSKRIIETIAREGRKFGAALCLISQRPVNLSTTALSQCSTHIILRITNPNDLEHIQASSEGIDARVARAITGLHTGEAIIVGAAVNHPVFIKVRKRKSLGKEKGIQLCEQAIKFEHAAEEKKRNVEAFL